VTIEVGNETDPLQQTGGSLDQKEIIHFQIFKDTFSFTEEPMGTQFEKNPLVHLNTLAQMVYEVVEKVDSHNLQPTVISLKGNIVEGVGRPGVYGFDFINETLIPIESLGVEEWNTLKEQAKSSLAVSFGLNIKESEGVKNEMKRILELHGDLEDIVAESPVGIAKLPLAYLHWIKGKSTL
jgi:hypothetical protein